MSQKRNLIINFLVYNAGWYLSKGIFITCFFFGLRLIYSYQHEGNQLFKQTLHFIVLPKIKLLITYSQRGSVRIRIHHCLTVPALLRSGSWDPLNSKKDETIKKLLPTYGCVWSDELPPVFRFIASQPAPTQRARTSESVIVPFEIGCIHFEN